ncbi:MAG: proline reductase-associated electron transfer protein PrdC [Turicibacter sp.]|nr:proline reductase-associated electron transfer protein PrdC [Turicibacter sp.]
MNVYIELRQHVGAPCRPLVETGDSVLRGQLIAEPTGLGANIHASVTGTVQEVTKTQIIIEMADTQPDDFEKIPDTSSHLEAIEHAGVVGAGGAGFPTHVKYATKVEGGVIIANAVECEPVLGHNVKLMEQHPEVIVRGLNYLLEISGAERAYIAMKLKHRKAALALGKACKNEPNIEVKFVSDMYPAGDERVIVRELLGVELQPGELPSVANAIVSNVETIKHVVNAIELRKPYIDKDLTISGRVQSGVKIFVDQPIGMPVSYYIEQCGGYIEPYGEIVIGGPFTGASGTEQTPLTKTTGGILVAMPFPQEPRKIGLLACECGTDEDRLRAIAEAMGAEVVASAMCKRMVEHNGRYRCDLPGICPGQTEKILMMKKSGAETVIAGSCES